MADRESDEDEGEYEEGTRSPIDNVRGPLAEDLAGRGVPVAELGNVASGLAEQLSSITEEMNKIRAELYGDGGIGGLAKELDRLKTGGLGGLLEQMGQSQGGLGAGGLGEEEDDEEDDEDDDEDGGGGLGGGRGGASGLGGFGGLGGASSSSSSSMPMGGAGQQGMRARLGGRDLAEARLRASVGVGPDQEDNEASDDDEDGDHGRSGAEVRARPERTPEERQELEEKLRRTLAARRKAKADEKRAAEGGSSGFLEKFAMLFVVGLCLYLGSPFFRLTVKRAIISIIYGADALEGMEEYGVGFGGDDDGEILAD